MKNLCFCVFFGKIFLKDGTIFAQVLEKPKFCLKI